MPVREFALCAERATVASAQSPDGNEKLLKSSEREMPLRRRREIRTYMCIAPIPKWIWKTNLAPRDPLGPNLRTLVG